MTEVARLYATLGANMTGFSQGMSQAHGELNTFQRGWSGLEGAVTTGAKVIGGALVAGFGALSGVVASATKSAANMEQGVANIAAVMRLTADETSQVKSLIRDLGIDPSLKVSAVEASQAIEMLGKNGMTLDDIMSGAARSVILLSNATGAEFAMSADVATDAMALFNLEAHEMERAVAGIVAVTQQSKFGVEDYRFALASAAPVLSSMGVSFEEFNAALTLSASNFASGRTAGTSWRLLMQNLVPSGESATKMMQELGFITADGANQFFTATGELKDMDQVIRLLQSGFSGLSAEQTTAYARAIFGQEALGALNAALGISVDELLNLIATQSDVNALNESAAVRVDTLSGAWEIFRSVLDQTIIDIGDKFLPIARRIVDWMTEMVSEHGPAVVEWFGKLAKSIEVFADSLINGEKWTDALRTALMEGFELDSEHPILKAIDWIEDLSRGFKNFITEQDRWPSDPAWLRTLMAFGDIARPIIQYIADLITEFVSWGDVITALSIVVSGILVRGIFGLITSSVGPVLAVFAGLVLAVATLRNAWENDWGGIRTFVGNAFDYLGERFSLFSDVWEAIGGVVLSELANFVRGNETNLEATKILWGAFVIGVQGIFDDLVSWVKGLLPEWNSATGSWGEAAVQWIETAIPQAVDAIGRYVNDIVTWVYVNANTWQITLYRWQRAAIDWIETAIPQAVEKIAEWGAAIWGWLEENLPIWQENLSIWGADMSQWISDTFIPTTDAMNRWGGLLQDWLNTNLPLFGATLMEWGIAAYQWIADAIPLAMEWLGRWYVTLSEWLTSNLPDWIAKLEEWGNPAWEIFAERFPKAAELFQKAWDFAKEKVIPVIASFIENLGKFGGSVWGVRDKIADFIGEHKLLDAAMLVTIGTIGKNFIPILTGPVGLVFHMGKVLGKFALLTAAVGLVLKAWEEDWGGVRTKTVAATEAVDKATSNTQQAIATFGKASLEEIHRWFLGNETEFDNTREIWEAAEQDAENLFQNVQGFAETYLEPFQKRVKEWGAVVWEWFTEKFPTASSALMNAKNQLGEALGRLTTSFGHLWESVKKLGISFDGLSGVIDTAMALIITVVTSALALIMDAISIFVALATGEWSVFWETFEDVAERTGESLLNIINDALNLILALFGVEPWKQSGRDMIQGLKEGFMSAWSGPNGVGTWLSNTWNSIPQGFRQTMRIASPSLLFFELGDYTMQGLANGLSSGFGAVDSALSGVMSGIEDQYNKIQGALNRTFTVPTVPVIPAPIIPAPMTPPAADTPRLPTSPAPTGPSIPESILPFQSQITQLWMSGVQNPWAQGAWTDLLAAARAIGYKGTYADLFNFAKTLPTNIPREQWTTDPSGGIVSGGPTFNVTPPRNPSLATNQSQLFGAIFGSSQQHIGAFQDAFSKLMDIIPRFAQHAFDKIGAEALGFNPLTGKADTGKLYEAVVGLINLNNSSARQVAGVGGVGGGERMLNALEELIRMISNKPANNITINVPPGTQDTSSVAYLVEYLNAMLTA